jgi:hypothetical protein
MTPVPFPGSASLSPTSGAGWTQRPGAERYYADSPHDRRSGHRHRGTATTPLVYGHLMPGADQRAVAVVGRASGTGERILTVSFPHFANVGVRVPLTVTPPSYGSHQNGN